jgi:hypothetical protein
VWRKENTYTVTKKKKLATTARAKRVKVVKLSRLDTDNGFTTLGFKWASPCTYFYSSKLLFRPSRLSVPTKLPLRIFWIVGFLIKLILECTFRSGIVFQFFFIFRKLQSEINKSWNVHFKVTFFFQIFLYFGSYNLKLTKFGLYLSNLFLFRIVASKLSRVQNQRYFWVFGGLGALWGPKKQFSTLYLTSIIYL